MHYKINYPFWEKMLIISALATDNTKSLQVLVRIHCFFKWIIIGKIEVPIAWMLTWPWSTCPLRTYNAISCLCHTGLLCKCLLARVLAMRHYCLCSCIKTSASALGGLWPADLLYADSEDINLCAVWKLDMNPYPNALLSFFGLFESRVNLLGAEIWHYNNINQ